MRSSLVETMAGTCTLVSVPVTAWQVLRSLLRSLARVCNMRNVTWADRGHGQSRSDPRWSKYIDPLTGRTVGAQLMLNQSFKTSMGYKWGGLAVVVFAAFFLNGLIWFFLVVLKGLHTALCLCQTLHSAWA